MKNKDTTEVSKYTLYRTYKFKEWILHKILSGVNPRSTQTQTLPFLNLQLQQLHGPTHNIFHAHFLHWWIIIILTYVNKYTTLSLKKKKYTTLCPYYCFFQINDNKFFCLTYTCFAISLYLNISIEIFCTFILNFWNFRKFIFKSSYIKQKLKFCKEIF